MAVSSWAIEERAAAVARGRSGAMLLERITRFQSITSRLGAKESASLVANLAVDNVLQSRLADAVNIYLHACISSFFSGQYFELGKDLLTRHFDCISALPNITPNGLILVKEPVSIEFTLVHRALVNLLDSMRFFDNISEIQFPINIRLVDSRPDPMKDVRPRASNKIHCDAWAGDPSNSFTLQVPVLGDVDKTGVKFWEVTDIRQETCAIMPKYEDGLHLIGRGAELDVKMAFGSATIWDSFALHATQKKGMPRVSVEFRFSDGGRISSDFDPPEGKGRMFLDAQQWRTVGRDIIIGSKAPLALYEKDQTHATDFGHEELSLINILVPPASQAEKSS